MRNVIQWHFQWQFRHFHFLTLVHTQTAASGVSFYDIFVQQQVPLFVEFVMFVKICDGVIAGDFWFAPPPIIKNSGYVYGTFILDESAFAQELTFLQLCDWRFTSLHVNLLLV